MKISREEVARVTRLARLALSEDKLDLFARQVGDILVYIDKLNELDTANVVPMYSPQATSMLKRPDEVRKEHTRKQVLSNAPEIEGAFFVVPHIISAGH